MKPLIPLAPATVVEHRPVERDDRLRGGDHELSIQEVVAIGAPQGKVSAVAGLVLGLMLANLEVGGARGDLHHVRVALTVDETQSRDERLNLRFILNVLSLFFGWFPLIFIPLLGEVAHNTYTSAAVAPTDTTLVILEFGADDAVAACAHTLPLHTHRAAVGTTLGPIRHLRAQGGITVSVCVFRCGHGTVPRRWSSPAERRPRSIRFLSPYRSVCRRLWGALPRTWAPTPQKSSRL